MFIELINGHYLVLGGSNAQWLAYLFPDPAAPGLIPNVPEIFPVGKNC